MIKVTDVAGKAKYINCELIEKVESTPDTVIFFINGNTMIVRDKPEDIIKEIIEFKHFCITGLGSDGVVTECGKPSEGIV